MWALDLEVIYVFAGFVTRAPQTYLNVKRHDRNSNNLGGFLHIKADLVHTAAEEDSWHLFLMLLGAPVGWSLLSAKRSETGLDPRLCNNRSTGASLSLEANANNTV